MFDFFANSQRNNMAARVPKTDKTASTAIVTISQRLKRINSKFIPRGSYILTPKTQHPAITPSNAKIAVNFFELRE